MNVAVIQARTGSSRLPGKVLLPLAGAPVLAHVVARARAVPGVEAVCCAIPDGARDDALAEVAAGLGAVVVRGSETDVLERYRQAARATDARAVMRITSDCPLFDPEVGGRVLAAFAAGGFDYCSNLEPRSWPKGLDCEVFSREALERAADAATDAYDREHVTPWLRRSPEVRRGTVALCSQDCAAWRWTLDHPEDFAFFEAVMTRLPPWPALPGFAQVRAVIEAEPALADVNAHLV